MSHDGYRQDLMSLVGNEDLLEVIQQEIKNGKISEKTYAKVFSLMYFVNVDPGECVSYSRGNKQWKRGKKVISDIKLFGLISNVCDTIRLCILDAWESSLISALTHEKVIQKIESELDNMESMDHLKGILRLAGELMVFANHDGQFNWDTEEEEEETMVGGDS